MSSDAVSHPDPRRWFTLVIIMTAVLVGALDTSILNVALPTILREFHTTLPALQWVITGYSLVFASLLIIGGRLGDIYGARRVFVIGLMLFGAGSFVASVSHSVPQLVVGEALIEGIGASLMLPATLAILSNTFTGPERSVAFAAWGTAAGSAVAFGPVLGGFLTTHYSWRWSFRINLIVAPIAILGALLFMQPTQRSSDGGEIDYPGAALVAVGTFLLVFGLSSGSEYGWWEPLKPFTLYGHAAWPHGWPVSVIPFAILASALLLTCFYFLERWKERRGSDPLFRFSQLQYPRFRYGLITSMVFAVGQLGLIFLIPEFLQSGRHLSALDSGLWLVPYGVTIIIGSQIGGRLARVIGPVRVIRTGLLLEAAGALALAFAISPTRPVAWLLPTFVTLGLGTGFASSQLSNVIMSDVAPENAGSASGANTTTRQLGFAIGIATIGGLLSTQMIRSAQDRIYQAGFPATLQEGLITQVKRDGVGFIIPRSATPADALKLHSIMEHSVATGTRFALLFVASIMAMSAALSWLIPTTAPAHETDAVDALDAVGAYVDLPDPA